MIDVDDPELLPESQPRSLPVHLLTTTERQPLRFTERWEKLNIAHHKSYHPYRRDNIERVRRDEEAERLKEEQEEGKMMVAVRCSSSL